MWNKYIKKILYISLIVYFIFWFVDLWILEEGRLFEWILFSNGKVQAPVEIALFFPRSKFVPMWIMPIDPQIVLAKDSPDVPQIKISWLNIYNK